MESSVSFPLSYIDLHCDTALELYERSEDIAENDLAISLSHLKPYRNYAQFFAIYSSHRLSDEACYAQFLAASDYFESLLRLPANQSRISPVDTAQDLAKAWGENKAAAFAAVEDARLLARDLSRLDVLRARRVRYLTLTWAGTTCVGGSHDTEDGLTLFGKDVVRGCFDRGIVPDISHASAQTAADTLYLAEKAGKPVFATHSDAFSVYPHRRNLRDEHFCRVRDLGGLVGINLFTGHLGNGDLSPITTDTILSHIDYYLSLDGEHTLAMGGDLDGADLPGEYEHVSDCVKIAAAMEARGYSREIIENLFWRNAQRFIQKNF